MSGTSICRVAALHEIQARRELGSRTAHLFAEAHHDVETVLQERLSGASDEIIFKACRLEDRCLVSLDLDFADVVRFPPHQTAGLAVLRLPKGRVTALWRSSSAIY